MNKKYEHLSFYKAQSETKNVNQLNENPNNDNLENRFMFNFGVTKYNQQNFSILICISSIFIGFLFIAILAVIFLIIGK